MSSIMLSSAASPAVGVHQRGPAQRAFQALPPRPMLGRCRRGGPLRARDEETIYARAQSKSVDLDAVLANLADKFEKAENKPAVIGYSAAAIATFFFSEWLIHLPGLNFLLGFPIQLIGLAILPYLGVKYFVEGDSIVDDIGAASKTVITKLPGLEKRGV